MYVPKENQNNKNEDRFEVLHLSLKSVGMHLDIFFMSAGLIKCILNFLNKYKIMMMIIKNLLFMMIGFTIVLLLIVLA